MTVTSIEIFEVSVSRGCARLLVQNSASHGTPKFGGLIVTEFNPDHDGNKGTLANDSIDALAQNALITKHQLTIPGGHSTDGSKRAIASEGEGLRTARCKYGTGATDQQAWQDQLKPSQDPFSTFGLDGRYRVRGGPVWSGGNLRRGFVLGQAATEFMTREN